MDYIVQKIRIIVAGFILICVGFGIGFFSKPTQITTKTKIKEVVRYVEKKQEHKNVKTTKKKTIKKDGEIVEEEITEDKSQTNTEVSSSSEKKSKKEEKVVNSAGITLSALVLARDLSVDEYEFGIAFSKRIFSNISVGVIATEKKSCWANNRFGILMPKYTFSCNKCSKSIQKYLSASQRFNQCECGEVVERSMPSISGTKTTETVDKLLNRKHIDNQSGALKERKLDYYWEVEVPRMVDSGIYSIETMLEQGWIYYNEKGELTTRTKSIQKS